MKQKLLIILGIVIFLSALISASIPNVPHQFFGEVIIQGIPAQEGVVTAKIEGSIVETGEISDGKYGYEDVFLIQDPLGDMPCGEISFYVNDIFATKHGFENGAVTRLDLIIGEYEEFCGNNILEGEEECDSGENNGVKCDNSKEDCEYCSLNCEIMRLDKEDEKKSSSNSGDRIVYIGDEECKENWKCSAWSSCDKGIERRNCYDENKCGSHETRPVVERECQILGKPAKEMKTPPKLENINFLLIIGSGFLVFLIFIVKLIK